VFLAQQIAGRRRDDKSSYVAQRLPIRPGPRKRTSNEAEDEPRFTRHYLGFWDLAGQIDRPSSEMVTTHWGSRRIV
jgi:hypothetical protein